MMISDIAKKNMQSLRRAWLANEKEALKEFKKLKKRLNKDQLRRLKKYQDKQEKRFTNLLRNLSMDDQYKFQKHGWVALQRTIPYIKYTLLKMKRPPKKELPVVQSRGGDPYTCGPEYFNRCCCC
jgi:hypothetical protein